jgi:SAM-dependent methyltransferase
MKGSLARKYRFISRTKSILRMRGKDAFIRALNPGASILDVGCGNDSALKIKSVRPDFHYIGLDIENYYQTLPVEQVANRYILTSSKDFGAAISQFRGELDAVISSHNLEHCDDPAVVLRAMCQSLKFGGRMYLAFPCERSMGFPRRKGTLNFYDDLSHRSCPSYVRVLGALKEEGFEIEFCAQMYRPLFLALAGLLLEPVSRASGKIMPLGTTWALYGFETIIWSKRVRDGSASIPATGMLD